MASTGGTHRAGPARKAHAAHAAHAAATGRGSHRAAPPRSRGPRRLVAGSLALGASLTLLLGGQGSYAFWTDKSTVTSGSITSGKLDLTVDGQQGNPTAYAATSLTLASMVPGESVAATVAIGNAGDADFTWVPTATTGGGLGPALTVQLFAGATAANTSAYPRTGTCTGGTQLTSGTTATRLNKGATAQTLCILVTLPSTTDNTYQSVTTGNVSIAVAATQALPS